MKPLSHARKLRIFVDMFNAEGDLDTLAKRNRVSLATLAQLGLDPDMRQYVDGLLVMADNQTQFMLSRYRINAATTLFGFVSPKQGEKDEKDEKVREIDDDLKRKACVDLLRLELKRTLPEHGKGAVPIAPEATPGEKLRELLYGAEEDAGAEAGDSSSDPGPLRLARE